MGDKSSFEIGEEVEVFYPDRWTLFPATIVGLTSDPCEFIVDYKSFDRREKVSADRLKPSPPSEANPTSFEFGDNVDALLDGGWFQGLVIEAIDSHSFSVSLRFSQQSLPFPLSHLRLHREWINGGWVPHLLTTQGKVGDDNDEPPLMRSGENKNDATNRETGTSEERPIDNEFREGELVEVRIDEDGFEGAWFGATIVEATERGKYTIKYDKLRRDDNEDFLTEAVDERQVRPCPLEAIIVDAFERNDEVDAYYKDGWWEGVILKVLQNGRYRVYFKGTGDDDIFEHSELRQHLNWVDGAWNTCPSA